MSRRSLTKSALLSLLALAISSFLSAPAQARRGVILITTGNTIKHVAEVAVEMKPVVRAVTGTSVDYHVGYLHERFGVFWIDLWTWGGEYVLYDDSEENLWTLDEEETASILGATPEQLSKPIFYTFPPGLLALGTIGAVCLIMQTQTGKRTAQANQEVERLLEDPRYERALEKIVKHDAERQVAAMSESADPQALGNDAAVFDRAVQQLVEQGIPYNDAYCNLNLLVDAARAQQA
jgi:hypothetical protein